MRSFSVFLVIFVLLSSTFASYGFIATATTQPVENLLVSLPAGIVVGASADPWLDKGWLQNITEHYGSFIVRINETSPSASGTQDIHLIIALNQIAYDNLINLCVNRTYPGTQMTIPKTSFRSGTPSPYNVWTWPDDVYPTWYNDTLINLGFLWQHATTNYLEAGVYARFSNATGAKMHFDAYGSSSCHKPTTPDKIIRNSEFNDSTVIFSPKIVIPPQADFTWCPSSPQTCETVTFDASTSTPGSGPIVSYNWNFGDGNTTSVPDSVVTHQYTNFGTFTVTLNITNSDGAWDTESKTITVRAHPHAAFTYSPHYPQVNETVTFDASASTPDGGTIISYEWDFGDSSPHQLGMTVTHNYTASGEYLVTLNVTDSEAKWATASKTVKVGLPPTPPHADFTWCPLSPQVGDTVTFNGSISTPDGGTIISYEWDFGDSSPHQLGVVVSHSYSSFGNFTVTLNVTDSEDEWDAESKTITVRGHPHAEFVWSPQIPYRQQLVTFNASASTPDGGYIVSYTWNFGDGNTTSVTGPIIVHRYNVSATYQVTLNVTDSECKWDAKSKSINIVTPPLEPEFAMQINKQWSDPTHPVILNGLRYCNTIEVDVYVVNVVDLYAYEFTLDWNTTYLTNVNYTVVHKPPFATDFVLKSDLDGNTGIYTQAVTATNPTPGFNGTTVLAILFFHIDNQAQWPNQVDLEFSLDAKASNSCTLPITVSTEPGFLKLQSVQPWIEMLPPKIIESVVGTTFTVQFKIHDIVKMKSFHIVVTWDPRQFSTDSQNVFIKNFLPPPYESTSITFGTGKLTIDVVIPCEKPSINGTGELFGIRFKALNPWKSVPAQAPGIPPYNWVWADKAHTHKTWYPDNCWNYINIAGYIDKVGGEHQDLGACDGVKVVGPDINPLDPTGLKTYDFDGDRTTTTVENQPCSMGGFVIGYYEFRPVVGDLDLNGHTDVVDLAAIAKYYGRTSTDGLTPAWATIQGFDLTLDGVIDIYDAVIASKNICRTTPDNLHPFPLPDP
jgi:PKD repeat protein